MFEYISGKLDSITPATAVVDCGGVGYLLEITLTTYSAIQEKQEVRLWVHEIIREDAYQLYGFYTPAEREMFRLLIGVNGVGAATARMMLSSLSVEEVQDAIARQDAKLVQRQQEQRRGLGCLGDAWVPQGGGRQGIAAARRQPLGRSTYQGGFETSLRVST